MQLFSLKVSCLQIFHPQSLLRSDQLCILNSFNLHSVHMYIYTYNKLSMIPSMLHKQIAAVGYSCDPLNLNFLLNLFTFKSFDIREPLDGQLRNNDIVQTLLTVPRGENCWCSQCFLTY